VGNRRHLNEDSYLAGPTFHVVADGMGGHRAGDVASALAVGVFRQATWPLRPSVVDIERLLMHVNVSISVRAEADRTFGMGTTIVGAVHVVAEHGGCAIAVFHVGDSRCYRLHAGVLTLLTRDHSHVQDLVDAGRIEPSAVALHPMRNVITRALGSDDGEADITVIEGCVGRLLLCSDGLTAEVDAATIGRVLAGVDDPQAAADRLVELALAGTADDNVTALVVDFDDPRDR
jgi:protein phosphatase